MRRERAVLCWLLVAGCWLLVAGCWLLVAGCGLRVSGGFETWGNVTRGVQAEKPLRPATRNTQLTPGIVFDLTNNCGGTR
ncbi:MAG TPA: hypothetical protein VGF28_01830 [Thermoanaerobaculia bacterium]